MKQINKDELNLFKQIKNEKTLLDLDEEVFNKTGKHPYKDYLKSQANTVYLANCVNGHEDVGEIADYEDVNKNELFIKWYNTLDEYFSIKKGNFNA